MIYILDAYNVIHKIPRLEALLEKDLRSARDGLMELCGRIALSRGDIEKMVLVFDGKTEFRDLLQPSPQKIELVFSDTGEEADERIGTVLKDLAEKVRKCVVSDDNFVRNQARAHKAGSLSVREFEKLLQSRDAKKRDPGASSRAFSISPEAADQITQAYKKELGLD